ncbi:GerAB/ArcD/ProY family transporter [Gottfriedia solisilvae]|uniref:Germination protein n=1 Tax=Gottfriedia solisilvae TaxID=1516104 RepID=A0A8J3ANS1_9BACI|nr:GerAB/ArcD/ProY family transporter [Gottfriedia solisilvae]GGI17923.1 germination protein [Gottfriedia solisilvae]
MNKFNLTPASFLVYGISVGTSTLIPFNFLDHAQDQGIATIAGGLWSVVLFYIYTSLLRYGNSEGDFLDLIKNTFSKNLSYIFLIFYSLFIWLAISKDLAIVWKTISTVILTKHSPTFVAFLFVLHIFLICTQGGIKSILQLSVFYASVCFVINIIILIMSMNNIEYTNFLPFFYKGVHPFIREFATISGNSSSEIFLLLFIPEVCKEMRTDIKRFLFPLIFIVATNLIKYTVSLGLLGEYLKYVPTAPGGAAAGVLTIGTAQIRIEPLVILAWFITAIIKISVEYYILSNLAARMVKNSNMNTFLFPIGIIACCTSLIIFKNQIEVINFTRTYAIYGTLFQFLIPLFFLISLKFKRIPAIS